MAVNKTYTYNGVTYTSAKKVRQAIWEAERKAFATEPEDGLEDFWAALGVAYAETEQEVSFASLKARKLKELEDAFLAWREDSATMVSSLGFVADADSRAMQDITGLWIKASTDSDFTTTFMDAENVAHTLGAEDVAVLASEVTQAGFDAYSRKWELRDAIEDAEDEEALDAVTVSFEVPDYTGGLS